MTTTTTFQGMEPGAKNSSRVLRPPGGASNISFGTDDDKTPVRKNKMASNIFAEPDDPHAHRRNNPPGGQPTGILCGEPSAPLRRCPQPLLFPKNDGLEQTSICNSAAAKVEVHEQANDECPEDGEADQEQREEPSLPCAPSGASPAASASSSTTGGRRNPPGGKSSLILG